MKKSLDLTISIVSFNTQETLFRCLESIYKYTKNIKFEVVVVDNASTDGSVPMIKSQFQKVSLISNRTNNYYTLANNQALKIAQGKYFLILNSDTYITQNCFQKMIRYLNSHPKIGAIEPSQLEEKTHLPIPTGSRHNTPLTDFFELTWIGRKLANQPLLNHFRLKSRSRNKTWVADVICDAALMAKTSLLRQLQGYDLNLKLYYTENDLCRRIQNSGLANVHFSGAKLYHRLSASTQTQPWQLISSIYALDAFYYFKRWHGILPASLIYLSLKINNLALGLIKNKWPFILIFILGAVLRFWRLKELMPFIGDYGHDYLAARDLLVKHQIPLLGIASSVPWLHQGVLWIYLLALILPLFNYHPVAGAVLSVILSLVALWGITEIAYKFWGKFAALASGLIFATSPLAVLQARTPWHTSPIPAVAIGFLYFLLQGSIFWSAVFAGLLFQFELSNSPLVLLLLWRFRLKRFWLVVIGFSLPLLPKIIYDLTHNFSQIGGFILWLGYRIAAFFGYRGAHTVSLKRLFTTSQIVFDYLQKFFSWGSAIPTIILILFIIWTLRRPKLPAERLLVYWLLVTFTAFFIHATPSEAYFPVLFPTLSLAVGWGISRHKFLLIPIIVLSLVNSWWLYHHHFGTSGLSLSERIATVDRIIRISPDKPVKLIGKGEGSQHATFLDNYRYLLWWRSR